MPGSGGVVRPSTSTVSFSKARTGLSVYISSSAGVKSHLFYCNVIIQPVTYQSAVYIIICLSTQHLHRISLSGGT